NNAGFFASDLFEATTQPFLMIVTDRSDYGDDRLNGIRGIEPPAQAGLERNHFAIALFEFEKRQGRSDFKKCRMRVPIRGPGADRVETRGYFFFGDHLAIN